jgi:hypothetical protein
MAELIWEGKYDKDGKKTAPLRVALPFQTVETVNESAQDRQKSLELFRSGRETEWRNRLIWGDKKYVLPSLLPEFAGKVNLIYIDPPFDTGADFSFQVEIDGENFTKEPSVIEMKAYRDTWGRGLDSYLQWFYETVVLLRELLHETGSIYVHLDWRVGHNMPGLCLTKCLVWRTIEMRYVGADSRSEELRQRQINMLGIQILCFFILKLNSGLGMAHISLMMKILLEKNFGLIQVVDCLEIVTLETTQKNLSKSLKSKDAYM